MYSQYILGRFYGFGHKVGINKKSVLPAGKRCLGCQHPAHFALQLGAGLAHQLGVVDQPVLGRVMLCFQGLDIMCT